MMHSNTDYGVFSTDASGLWHYTFTKAGSVAKAVEDAIAYKRDHWPAWFWFNGTPAPMFQADTPAMLLDRWYTWRLTMQEKPQELLPLLRGLTREPPF